MLCHLFPGSRASADAAPQLGRLLGQDVDVDRGEDGVQQQPREQPARAPGRGGGEQQQGQHDETAVDGAGEKGGHS